MDDTASNSSSLAEPPSTARYIRSRISNACDGCKSRKVKCDGKLPCRYCAGRQRPEDCHYSPQRRRRQQQTGSVVAATAAAAAVSVSSQGQGQGRARRRIASPPSSVRGSTRTRSLGETPPAQIEAQTQIQTQIQTPTPSSTSAAGVGLGRAGETTNSGRIGISTSANSNGHSNCEGHRSPEPSAADDETEVPREARLLCDARGKLTFLGDCAPLSFFQSVRQLVTTKVGQNAFAPQTSRFSVLENTSTRQHKRFPTSQMPPPVRPMDVASAVSTYLATTASLVDLFDSAKLLDDLHLWVNLEQKPENETSIVNYLVLAIGHQPDNEELSHRYFEYARDLAYFNLSDNLSVETAQAFALVTLYMLCTCQINGAFLFFGIAVRAAYSIGVHRTEVNARFGTEIHRQRDRLWKSLRVVDLFVSNSMGRPPATSDVDCTVPYHSVDGDGNEVFDLLNASVQILLITEGIVLEIYSRKKISMQLTEGISLQLRDWSGRWLGQLKSIISQPDAHSEAQITGACQVLSSYYYSVMLVSRPFLMYELWRRLSDGQKAPSRAAMASGKSKLADACIDAATLMVDPILNLIERNILRGRMPLLVSWLFASSLVLGLGLLGRFGRILEKYTRMSIQAMEHFAKSDAHAQQYSLIAQSLLTTALEHLERQELQERQRRTESSSQLFGLMPPDSGPLTSASSTTTTPHRDMNMHARGGGGGSEAGVNRNRVSMDRSFLQHLGHHQGMASPGLGDVDSAFLSLSDSVLHTPDTAYWNDIVNSEGDPNSALNLFPLLEAGGGIDLAHWL